MADDDKLPAKNITNNGLIVAVLILTGTAVYFQQAPLQPARPPVTEAPLQQKVAREDVEARLWQDPVGAAAKQYSEKVGKSGGDEQGGSTNACGDDHCKSPLQIRTELRKAAEETQQDSKPERILVLAATVPGDFYAEDVEWRRRARYAIVSALSLAKLVPTVGNHIGYFLPCRPDNLPQSLHEAFRSNSRHLEGGSIARKRSRKLETKLTAAVQSKPMIAGRSGSNGKPSNEDSSCTPDGEPWSHIIVPYEWFSVGSTKAPSDTPQNVLLLWVNEDVLGDQPLRVLTSLVNDLCRRNLCSSEYSVTINFLGPNDSTTLSAMVDEAKNNNCPPNLKNINLKFYASGPTYVWKDDAKQFLNKCVELFRTTATDDTLADGISNELSKRDFDPVKYKHHVALISEFDSLYGRNFPETITQAFTRAFHWSKEDSRDQLHKYSYLRGLDGETPAAGEIKKEDKDSTPNEKPISLLDFIRPRPHPINDTKNLERPYGQGEFDYLRRIADDLVSRDEELRVQGRGIKAIGVVGTDVYDKLLVLRALRPAFPDALFFTIDLDAALTMPSELDWTRNLIVASSFGLELHPDIQRDIPPFRDSYETAIFLAALLAIQDFPSDRSPKVTNKQTQTVSLQTQPDPQTQLGNWFPKGDGGARIFEISRTGRVLALGRQKPEQTAPPCTDPSNLNTCSTIQPPIAPLYHRLMPSRGAIIGKSLLVLASLLLVILLLRPVREAALPFVVSGSIVAFSCGFAFLWPGFAEGATDYGDGEPLTLQGASIWPTIILRTFGIMLSFSLLWQGLRRGKQNLEKDVAEYLDMDSPDILKNQMAEKDRSKAAWRNLRLMFSYRLTEGQQHESQKNKKPPYQLDKAWRYYIYSGRPEAQSTRAFVFVVFMLFLFYIIGAIFGRPAVPARTMDLRYSDTSRCSIPATPNFLRARHNFIMFKPGEQARQPTDPVAR